MHGSLLALRILTRKFEFRSGAEPEVTDAITKATLPTTLEIIEVGCSHELLQYYCTTVLG